MKISLIIPAYNAAAVLQETLEEYYAHLQKRGEDFEILVVVDGTDRTGELVQQFSKTHPKTKLLEYDHRLGKGGAIHAGFDKASGAVIGFVDADSSVGPVEFDKLLHAIASNGGDVAVASRKLPSSDVVIPRGWKDRLGSWGWGIYVRLLFPIRVKDLQCGGKVFTATAVRKIREQLKLAGLEFDVELLWRAYQAGFKIVEVPIRWKNSEHSISSIKNWFSMFWGLLRLRVSG